MAKALPVWLHHGWEEATPLVSGGLAGRFARTIAVEVEVVCVMFNKK